MVFFKKVSLQLFLFPLFFSSAVQAQNTSNKIGSFCIFQNNPTHGEWAKDANGKIIELNVRFIKNMKCDDYEFEEIKRYTDFYAVDFSNLPILINSCKNLKKSLLSKASSRQNIQNQNIDLNDLDNYLSPQARIIPDINDTNNNFILSPFAIQNQVRINDYLFLSTYYTCK
jgi:hypothetical protein